MRIPAFCRDCGRGFPSDFEIANAPNVILQGNTSGPCPECGGTGDVLEGNFAILNETLTILSAPDVTRERLQRLASEIELRWAAGVPAQEIAQDLDEISPALRRYALRSVSPEALPSWLMLVAYLANSILSGDWSP